MVCWAFLLRSFGAEQICHTRWPIEIFAHACVDVTPISTPFARIHMRSCQTPMALFPGLVVCWALLLQSFRAERIVHTRWPTEIFAHACVEVQGLQCERLLLRFSWPAAFVKPSTRTVRPATHFRFCIQLSVHVQTGQTGVGIAQLCLQQSDALLPAAVERPGPCDLEDENWEPGWASHGMQP